VLNGHVNSSAVLLLNLVEHLPAFFTARWLVAKLHQCLFFNLSSNFPCGTVLKALLKNRVFCTSVLKTIYLITEECWFSLGSLINSHWILSYFIFLWFLLLFPPNVFPDTFIPLSQLVIVALFYLGSICYYVVLFWKCVQTICNPLFILRKNSTNIVLPLSWCAVLGISLTSVLLADFYEVTLFLTWIPISAPCRVPSRLFRSGYLFRELYNRAGLVLLRYIFLRISHLLANPLS